MEQEQLHQLKQKVIKMLVPAADKPSQMLNLIEGIQRLGVSYHFTTEIEAALKHIYETCDYGHFDDLYTVALFFRLLRQQGFPVSCEVFNKFKNNEGKFQECLIGDVVGILSLYEATHLRVRGEEILDEALTFTTTHLESMVPNLSNPIAEHVVHALNQPIHKGLTRLDARRYISFYEQDDSHNKDLVNFAKLDFNLLQKLHQRELSEITRWEISALDQLPEYMKLCYQSLLDVYSMIDEEMAKQGGSYRVDYAKSEVNAHTYLLHLVINNKIICKFY
ncbi:probable sesquiterpene synthase [Actinidia eriantha]|uniref:probable sesquiterpene synthase n=1 Tax=Actinidia eriantha TaxID=165200 RepID=UPI0025864C2E|nr:probable sesquiterpene synthase [Actinidia eriantha]